MVDPLEAKRIAGKQMEEIKGREKQQVRKSTLWMNDDRLYSKLVEIAQNVILSFDLQRRREIEAINGAWAIIGLTIGLVIEAQTGKGILAQVCYTYTSSVLLRNEWLLLNPGFYL